MKCQGSIVYLVTIGVTIAATNFSNFHKTAHSPEHALSFGLEDPTQHHDVNRSLQREKTRIKGLEEQLRTARENLQISQLQNRK